MKRMLGLSTCGKRLNRALFTSCAENGIGCLEISLPDNEYDSIDWNTIVALSEETGVMLRSLHLPFSPFETTDISSLDEGIRASTIKRHKALMSEASAHGIGLFVIHASVEPINGDERESRLANAVKSLGELADFAEKISVVLAVEDLPRTCLGNCSRELLMLVKDKRLAVCFDTNHLLGEEISDFIRAVAPRIATTHISDYDRVNERHWLPGEGVIDWVELITLLFESGYNGPLVYELGFEAPPTIDRPRPLDAADFRRNFEELCGKKPLTVLGKAHKNL